MRRDLPTLFPSLRSPRCGFEPLLLLLVDRGLSSSFIIVFPILAVVSFLALGLDKT